jgi:hypothetical protein
MPHPLYPSEVSAEGQKGGAYRRRKTGRKMRKSRRRTNMKGSRRRR